MYLPILAGSVEWSVVAEEILNPDQCRAARAILGWSRADLAEACEVAPSTLADFEAGKRTPYRRTLADVRRAFEVAGVLFVSADLEGGCGVRFANGGGLE